MTLDHQDHLPRLPWSPTTEVRRRVERTLRDHDVTIAELKLWAEKLEEQGVPGWFAPAACAAFRELAGELREEGNP
jgi:hypothetical protein